MPATDVVAGVQDTGGVAPQHALGLPDHPPTGLHTVYETVPEEHYLGPNGRQQWLVNKQGLRLKTYLWPAAQAKAVLIFAHGHAAHSLFELLRTVESGQPPVYAGSWAERFNTAGISVAALDNQGCGRSEGLRFYVESFDHYINDVCQLASEIKAGEVEVPGFSASLPRFMGGISMGGCIAFNATLQRRDLFKGCLLLAPMLSLERVSRRGLNPYLRPLSTLLSMLVPTAAIVATDKNTLFPEIQAVWDKDPLVSHCKTRVRNANEYLRVTEETMKRLEEVDFPFCVWHSENDTMCDCEGSKQLYLRASSTDKTLRLVNSMWHVLVREDGNEKICNDMIEWMLARLD